MVTTGSPAAVEHRPGALRLRRVSATMPGLSRRRRGRGFEYRDVDGQRVMDPEILQRISDLMSTPSRSGP